VKAAGDEDDEDEFFGSRIETQRERLKFNDHLAQGQLFKNWTPFKHPVYGDIEIGGWIKYSSRIPAPFMLKDLVHRNASAVIFSAKQTPNVKMTVFDTKKIGKKLYRIRVRLENSTAMPTMSYEAQKHKLYPQDMLKISGPQAKIVAGGKLENLYTDEVSYKKHRPELLFLFVPGFGKSDHQFLVSGSGTVTITYQSRHTGTVTQTVSLKF